MTKLRARQFLKYAPLLLTRLNKFQNYYALAALIYPLISTVKKQRKTIEHNVQRKVKRGPVSSVMLTLLVGIALGRLIRK